MFDLPIEPYELIYGGVALFLGLVIIINEMFNDAKLSERVAELETWSGIAAVTNSDLSSIVLDLDYTPVSERLKAIQVRLHKVERETTKAGYYDLDRRILETNMQIETLSRLFTEHQSYTHELSNKVERVENEAARLADGIVYVDTCLHAAIDKYDAEISKGRSTRKKNTKKRVKK